MPVAEKFSLHRVRDSMGATLEPVVGLLRSAGAPFSLASRRSNHRVPHARVLKRLLNTADPEYSSLLERSVRIFNSLAWRSRDLMLTQSFTTALFRLVQSSDVVLTRHAYIASHTTRL